MLDLKLAKLPDRTPVKLSISVSPDLHAALRDYAEIYRDAYGTGESISELIPYMLSTFIKGDMSFKRARRERRGASIPLTSAKSSKRHTLAPADSKPDSGERP